jgi:Citrate synthase
MTSKISPVVPATKRYCSLWNGTLPTVDELETFSETLAAQRDVHECVLTAIEALADGNEEPMAALRTGISMLSVSDTGLDIDSASLEAVRHQGGEIVAKIPTVLAAFQRFRENEPPVEPDPKLGYAANFLYMLTGTRPDPVSIESFDEALTLHTDHGLNASTFTAMVIGSTMADIYSAVTGAIGALSGSLHGGANQDVMKFLRQIRDSGRDPVEWVTEYRDAGNRVPGFGHRVYDVTDPRAGILQERLEVIADNGGDDTWLEYTSAIKQSLEEEGLSEQGIAPNVDFFSGAVYDNLGIPDDLYTPIFAMARSGGWIAHTLEYQTNNRLIRPRAKYTGETSASFTPLKER